MTIIDIIHQELQKSGFIPDTEIYNKIHKMTLEYCKSKMIYCDFDRRSPKEYFKTLARNNIIVSKKQLELGLLDVPKPSKKSFIRRPNNDE